MKRVILLPIILGLTLTLTGCKPNDAKSSAPENQVLVTASETASAVSTETAISSVTATISKENEAIAAQSEPIVTDALDTPEYTVTSVTEVTTPVTASVANSDEIILSGTASPQLETVPENEDNEEDTGDLRQ